MVWYHMVVWYGMVPYLKRADEAKEAVSAVVLFVMLTMSKSNFILKKKTRSATKDSRHERAIFFFMRNSQCPAVARTERFARRPRRSFLRRASTTVRSDSF